MTDRNKKTPSEPSVDQPLHGPRRKSLGPAVLTLLLLALVAVVFLLILTTAP